MKRIFILLVFFVFSVSTQALAEDWFWNPAGSQEYFFSVTLEVKNFKNQQGCESSQAKDILAKYHALMFDDDNNIIVNRSEYEYYVAHNLKYIQTYCRRNTALRDNAKFLQTKALDHLKARF